jgi:type II secretory pathway pseudopilin PulG
MDTSSLKKAGFSLIEMIIYLSLLAAILIMIVNILISFSTSYRELSVHRALERSALSAMERMTRDIRAGTSIDTGNSSFGSTNGILSIIQTTSSVSTTTKFYIGSSTLKMDINDSYYGPLTSSDVAVSSFMVRRLTSTSTNAEAVKIDLTLQATSRSYVISKNYHSTIIVQGQ